MGNFISLGELRGLKSQIGLYIMFGPIMGNDFKQITRTTITGLKHYKDYLKLRIAVSVPGLVELEANTNLTSMLGRIDEPVVVLTRLVHDYSSKDFDTLRPQLSAIYSDIQLLEWRALGSDLGAKVGNW